MKKKLLTTYSGITITCIFILAIFPCVYAQDRDCCKREAVFFCDYFNPATNGSVREEENKKFCAAVQAKLNQLLTRDCFKIIPNSPADAANMAENEYQLEVKYKAAANYMNGPPNPQLTLNLYFIAESYRDLVYYWEVDNPGSDPEHDDQTWPLLLTKLANSISSGPDITELIERYEKRPVKVEMGMDKEILEPGEVTEIFLTGFTDKFGETSREFNRVIVHTEAGEITNGAVTDIGPDYIAYKVNNNFIKIKYKAPEDCKNPRAKISVYNSCDVLPESIVFMNRTQMKDKVAEKELGINCNDATITIRKQYEKTLTTSHQWSDNDASCPTQWNENQNLDESINASISLSLKLDQVVDMPIMKQTWEYYIPVNVSLGGFSYNYSDKKSDNSKVSGMGCANGGHETTVDRIRNLGTYEIENKQYISQSRWILVLDNVTGEALKIIPAGYTIKYKVNEEERTNSVVYSDNKPDKRSSTTNKEISATFKLGPVGKEIADPTIKKSDTWIKDYLKDQGVELPPGVSIPTPSNEETIKKIPPDIVVSTGDGKTSFGGEGNFSDPKQLEYGSENTEMHYTWHMTRRKIK